MQSWQTCAFSGEQIETPVISKVSGHIFEKRLIEKHIESTGTCPITGRLLNLEDLIDVKVSTVQKPRSVTATSIPSLLSLMQNEWDAVLLEQFQLKQHLEQVRQELTHALYQHDAACRVIAKLIKERDQARIELAQLHQKLSGKVEIETESTTERLPQQVIQDVEQAALKLSNERKAKRKQPSYFEQFPSAEVLSQYELKHQSTLQQGGVSIDINRDNSQLLLIGGVGGSVTLYDRSQSKGIFTSDKHQKRVTFAQFIYIDETIRFMTGSEDGNAYVYQYAHGKASITYTYNTGNVVVGIAIHPIGYLAIIGQENGIFSFHDIRSSTLLCKVNEFEGQVELTTLAVHPDGHFLALGQRDSMIKVWSISGHKLLAQLEGQDGSVTALVFSESGGQLASSSVSEVVIWSLRNSEVVKKLFQGQKIGQITYDQSGQYLAVGTTKFVNLVDTKKWETFLKVESHRDLVTGIKFGNEGQCFASCSTDKLLNIYNN